MPLLLGGEGTLTVGTQEVYFFFAAIPFMFSHLCSFFASVVPTLTPLEPQSRLGTKLLEI